MSHLDRKPTLVMGARGSVGKFVLDALLEQGVPVRASARKPEPGQLPDGVDVFAADLTDPASLAVAFDGVGQVFLYANHEGVDGVVAAARDAGVAAKLWWPISAADPGSGFASSLYLAPRVCALA